MKGNKTEQRNKKQRPNCPLPQQGFHLPSTLNEARHGKKVTVVLASFD
jgi:hypothetical protein